MDAKARGWGDVGLPGSAIGKLFQRNNIIKVEAGGVEVFVHRGIAPLVKGFLNELVSRGYDLARLADDWGFNHRYIAGTHILSNHSWGLALDLNATKNPMTHDGKVHTDMPGWVVACARKWGFFWGGNYSGSKKDPMHFEFLGTPHDAAVLIAALAHQPAPAPAQPSKEDVMDISSSPSWVKRQPNGRFPAFVGHSEPDNNSFAVLSKDNAAFVSPAWKEGRKDEHSEDGVIFGLWFRRFFNTGNFSGYGEADGVFFAIAENGTYDISKK